MAFWRRKSEEGPTIRTALVSVVLKRRKWKMLDIPQNYQHEEPLGYWSCIAMYTLQAASWPLLLLPFLFCLTTICFCLPWDFVSCRNLWLWQDNRLSVTTMLLQGSSRGYCLCNRDVDCDFNLLRQEKLDRQHIDIKKKTQNELKLKTNKELIPELVHLK